MARKSHRRGARDSKGRGVQAKVHKVMSEFKDGTLRDSNGEVVTKHDQAIAIALSMAREESDA